MRKNKHIIPVFGLTSEKLKDADRPNNINEWIILASIAAYILLS
jgi:hypothetical protein